jgi:flagellin
MAENAARHLGSSYDSLARSVERLSSGLRINSAKDDAAGLAVRELIRADVAKFRQGGRNAQDAISMLQTSEGAMGVMDDILIRMSELAEQAATGSYSTEQRTIMDAEYSQLKAELSRIAENTAFNGIQLLNSTSSYAIHIGSTTTIDIQAQEAFNSNRGRSTSYARNFLSAGEITNAAGGDSHFKFKFGTGTQVNVDLSGYDTTGISLDELVDEVNSQWQLSVSASTQVAFAHFDTSASQWKLKIENPVASSAAFTAVTGASAIDVLDSAAADFSQTASGVAGAAVDLTTQAGAEAALALVDAAIASKDSYRAQLGYMMNRLEAAVDILEIQSENLLAAESRISDVDVAVEMAAMTRNQVLAQAGVSMLAQANSMPQMAMKLLG